MLVNKTKFKLFTAALALALPLGLASLSYSQSVEADDTEIFFGEAKTANLMLVLDESGSMSFKDADAADDELLVNYWQQGKKDKVEAARDRLAGVDEDKARFATLQAYTRDGWVDYIPYNTQFSDRLEGWDLGVIYRDVYYRWIYKDNRMTRLKEALYIFLTSEKTKDNNQIGMMSYSGGRNNPTILHENVRRLDKVTGGISHRQSLINKINDLQPSFGTPTAEGYYQATQYMGGAYTQNGQAQPSPILEGACGYNSSIVLFTDGIPTVFEDGTSDDITKIIGSCDANVSDTQNSTNNGKECTIDLSAHYFVNDVKSNFPGSTLQTSTVAFAFDEENATEETKIALNFLEEAASSVEGRKLFFKPKNVNDLVRSFDESLNAVQDTTSFVAPSIPLSQSNRLRHSNNLYMGMFKPAAKETWFGNLKKYELKEGFIYDKNGDPAVDADSGTFIKESVSFWGNVEDGNRVEVGGALPKISVGAESAVYSNLTNNNLDKLTDEFVTDYIAKNALKLDFQDRIFGANNTLALPDLSSEEVKSYYDWIRNRITELEGLTINRFGDVLHSKPEILEYDANTATAFVATNQGYIHAIDIITGQERWAFFPRQMMKNVPEWHANAPVNTDDVREYGVDGTITLHTEVNNGVKSHYLYVGLRRGGNYVYALDVTNVNAPEIMFTVGDEFEFSRTELGYDTTNPELRTVISNLGQTWSKPVVVKMHDASADGFEKRLVLAGGYDTYYDNRTNTLSPASDVIKGDAIYDMPYKGGAEDAFRVTADEASISNSFAGDLTFIDIDNNTIVDHIYAADVAGKVYRIDFEKGTTSKSIELLADVSDPSNPDGPYRFYGKPDIAFATYGGVSFAVVNLGSGHRANPKATGTQDRYYAFFDYEVTGVEDKGDIDPIGAAQLLDVTTAAVDPITGEASFATVDDIVSGDDKKKGWYFSLQENEKVLSSSITIDFTTLFTTYIPAPAGCGVTSGVNRLYGVGLLDGAPSVPRFATGTVVDGEDRYTPVKYVGIAPGATVLFPEDTPVALLVGTQTVCTGADCDFFNANVRTVKWKQQE